MKIGLILMGNSIGGAEKRFARLYSYLSSQSNHKYTLILPEGLCNELYHQQILTSTDQNIIKIFAKPLYSLYNKKLRIKIADYTFGTTLLLAPLLRQELFSKKMQSVLLDFDIIHFCPPHPVLRMPKNKTVILEEPNSQSMHKPSSQVLKWLHSGAYINCLTRSISQVYKKAVSDPKMVERIFTAPCSFIDYGQVLVAPKERLVAFVGRMEKVKNPEVFVSAIEIAAKHRDNFRAVMLGTGRLDQKISNLIVKKNLNNILLKTYSSNPFELLSRAALFVSIQEFDNYPSQSLIEAMASGCAVIASDRGETKKLVTDDVGFCVPLSAEAVAERIIQMLDNFDRTVLMGHFARAKVMNEHTITRYANYIEGIYRMIC